MDSPHIDAPVGSESWPVDDDSADARFDDDGGRVEYIDTPVSSESIYLYNTTRVSVVVRSYCTNITDVAITLWSWYPDFGKSGGDFVFRG